MVNEPIELLRFDCMIFTYKAKSDIRSRSKIMRLKMMELRVSLQF